MPWKVVLFTTSNEVEIVPVNWITSNDTMCWYPKGKKHAIQSAIKSEVAPQASWNEYGVRALTSRIFEDFKDASKKASKACLTSDISDCITELPQKRLRNFQ